MLNVYIATFKVPLQIFMLARLDFIRTKRHELLACKTEVQKAHTNKKLGKVSIKILYSKLT